VDQAKLLDFMGQRDAYDPAPAAVDRIETHASVVFLAGPLAYKVKKAVRYPFLDFSTLENREAALRNELRLNRRAAPELYLAVVPITADREGFRLDGTGNPVEWALVMRRFPQSALLDRMAEEGRLDPALMRPLAQAIASLHASADRILTLSQATGPLAGIIAEHEAVLAENPGVFPPEAAAMLMSRTREAFTALTPHLRARARDGYIRHCHGDLHLRNIVAMDGVPILFDALEFDDSLASIDVLYDLAFLLMDLGKRGLTAHANILLNAYLDAVETGNLLGLAALPLFLSLRATIRAKVALLRSTGDGSESSPEDLAELRTYFDLACSYLTPTPPRLIVIGGLSGSGKSALAQTIAPEIAPFPGALLIRSDVERKRLFGVPSDARLPEQAYTQQVSDQVYALCRKRAAFALEAGRPVILDAVHAKPAERDVARALAQRHGVAFTGLWLDVPPEVMRKRVATREGDASDATPEVVDAQRHYDLGDVDFARIEASGALADVAKRCLAEIQT
jgi:aminoglycoside phosphotransferase family enzyme/predicted kinase